MPTRRAFERYGLIAAADAGMARAADLDAVLEVLRAQARAIADADGVTVVRREDDMVHYVGEDAISPLWTGQRFAIQACISGLAILAGEPIAIPDIARDMRVPHSAYLSTFVQSMAMFPIGRPTPVAALGLYWRDVRPLDPDVAGFVDLLTLSANAALQRIAHQADSGSRAA